MKKGLVVVVIVVLFLCILAVLGGGAAWYFLLRNTPQKAFDASLDSISTGDYYQYKMDTDVETSLGVPEYPEYDMEYSMSVTGEGKVDIQNSKSYVKSITEYEGVSNTQEVYIIGDDVYVKFDDDDFEKVTSEDDDYTNKQFDVYEGIDSDTEYTVLDEAKIGDVDCYHYKVPLDKIILESMIESFTEATSNSQDVSMDDITLEDAYLEMWVSKSSSKLMKTITKIGTFRIEMISKGIEMNMSLDGMEVIMVFSNWGEKVDIVAPI
jgi:hypothetical protein